ncbi:Nramp family divalent metal transporter [Clostridium sp. YIM B02515]|uniref:Divalent metal cation transporter MntH n=1 Tax=Clostridium rhizosphaerae TaxID=2803861 RepID=A0ABS1TDW8_9CLOT|nr:Nramp family divalent metal transporter [Clostridium rhizosphaerae]MBL4937563.1 Nramp family divalent metal transporter [Clostridium rhizosphaerae]
MKNQEDSLEIALESNAVYPVNVKEINNKLSNRFKSLLKFLGPAFVVSVAYVDPGNFATNISGGSIFNYNLIWVILWSNIMAIFLQIMSAKLGIATGSNLTEMCRKIFSKKINWFFWVVAELAAIATTMAEFIGGALGLYLLFRIPLPLAGLLTGIITFGITYLQKYGQRVIEIIITVLVAVISISYAVELVLAKPDWTQIGIHTLIPSLPNGNAVLIAAGMLGATVMPHVIYLHSELVQSRNGKKATLEDKKRHLKMEKIDVVIAMNIAFIVNAAMVVVSASVFHSQGLVVDSIEQAHRSLEPLLGSLSSFAFGMALLASGLSSSTVGAMAGETVMDGFVDIKLPANIKRLITMAPAMLILIIGINPMKALVLSQVCLSFALPMAIIPMLIITSRKNLMGIFVNKTWVKVLGILITTIIVSLNIMLLYLTFTGSV